jgi:hypothetical protein
MVIYMIDEDVSLKKKYNEDAYSPAYMLVIILFTFLTIFLLYGIFNDYVVTVFYNMILLNGGDEGFANFAVNWWQYYFIIAFVISLIIFVIVNAQRREEY